MTSTAPTPVPLDTPDTEVELSDWNENYAAGPLRGIRMICRRELSERLASKTFVFSTGLLAVFTFAGIFFTGGSADDVQRVGYTGDVGYAASALEAAGNDAIPVSRVDDRAEAERLLDTDEISAVLTGNDRTGYTALVRESLSPEVEDFLNRALETGALEQLARDSGAQDADVSGALRTTATGVEVLDPAMSSSALLVAMISTMALALVIVLWGNTLASGVVDEKASRVVEVLLATIRPWQLLTGKVIAIAVLGFVQVLVLGAAAMAVLVVQHGGSALPTGLFGPTLFIGLISLVLGVLLYFSLMAAFAARVERQEDLGAALQPVFALSLGPFAASFMLALQSPDSIWVDVFSIAPFFGPFAMPLRYAVKPVPVWQLMLSLIVCLATIAAVGALSGRIYGNSILRSGGRVSMKEALTST